MLSKSQARLFFVAGTVLFSGVFLYLTVDSIAKVPDQTHEDQLTPEAIHGKHLFDENNCMGCHTILGEGAYYAPELTKVYDRRGPEWIKTFIKDPEAMYPNQRKMVKYNFSEQELDDIVAFFKWIGEMDLNGFPADPDPRLAPAPAKNTQTTSASNAKAPPMFSQLCTSCHSLNGQGGNVGPSLDGVGTRRDEAWLDTWLKNPAAVKPGTTMPKITMSDQERLEMAQFLTAQK